MKKNTTPFIRLLLATLLVLAGGKARALEADSDSNGKYDTDYDRPTYFPDWQQPSDWPNAEYYVVAVRLGENGPRLENYEVAVYDQNNNLRYCNRSMQKDDHACVLTIKGTEGDKFHCQIIFGDFTSPIVMDVPETFGFKTNDIVGTVEDPFWLTLPGRTYLYETDTKLPNDKTNADVTVVRALTAGEWGTICLPFAMDAGQVKEAFGDDVKLGDFTGCDVTYTDESEETVQSINVKFNSVTAIEANHPYIIKVSKNITSFEVDGVDVAPAQEPKVMKDRVKMLYNQFIGNYQSGFKVPEKCLFLSGGKFYYSVGKTPMMAFRAYFDFYDVLPKEENSEARIAIIFNDGEATSIRLQTADRRPYLSDVWYRPDGRRLEGKPAGKGLYINNGRKVMTK